MSACPHEASHAVKAMSNIGGCDESDDIMFFSLSGFTDSLLSLDGEGQGMWLWCWF